MKKSNKWKLGLLFFAGIILTGCTKSFCTVQDKVNMMYNYEVTVNKDNKTNLQQIIDTVNETENYFAPSNAFFDYIEDQIVEDVLLNYSIKEISYVDNEKNLTTTYEKISKDATLKAELTQEGTALRTAFVKTNEYALVKYAEANATSLSSVWKNFNKWKDAALDNPNYNLTLKDVGSDYFYKQMKNKYNAYTKSITACITPEDKEFDGLKLQGKSWGAAFKLGLIEGLLVWPISTMLYYFTLWFSAMGWFGTILAIFLVTIIVRGVLLLCTFKQTMSQQKMNDLQPELRKIQEKYPNANTNTYEKNAMAQEQMALYKKHGVSPFGMFIVMIFQFPIFIAVWGAMSGSAILRDGQMFGLSFADNSWNAVTHWSGSASVVAIIVFVLMAVMQAVSMLLPQRLQNKRTEKVAKTGKNPAQKQNNNQMKIMTYVMLIMIIFMGATLPIAMSIYWFISAFVSLAQTLIMSSITNKRTTQAGYVKYKTK